MKPFAHLIVFFLALFCSALAPAATESVNHCLALQSVDWSPQEVWVWDRLCRGQDADLNELVGSGQEHSPWEITRGDWDTERTLRSDFLYDMVRYEPFRTAMQNKRIRIIGAWFQEPVDLSGATIENFFALDGSRFDQRFIFQSGITHSRFSMAGSWFREGFLFGFMSAAEVYLVGARFDGAVAMPDIDSSKSIVLGGNEFAGYVILAGSRADELVMNNRGVESVWKENAQLSLRGVQVNILEDTETSWTGLEGKLDLQGFQYSRYGGVSDSFDLSLPAATGSERPVEILLAWLAMQESRDQIYMPQPYEQLARVLAESGQTAKANRILYEMNEYRRTHVTTSPGQEAWLTTKKVIIGYGYQIWLTVLWFISLILAGALLLRFSAQGRALSLVRSILYSLDQALPLVYLNPLHEDVARQHSIAMQYYFQAHQVLSLILLSFLGAGLAGAIG